MENHQENLRIEFEGLPKKNDAKFSQTIQRPRRPGIILRREETPQYLNQREKRKINNKRPAPYVSFGDRGTTASAGVYGSLLRICRPVQGEHGSHLHSKIIGLGPIDDPEAWYVYWRTSQFLENAQVRTKGIGLRALNALTSKTPSLEFIAGRWPVISYETREGFVVDVRLWCQHNVIVQQMRVSNVLNRQQVLNLELDPNFSLQDLDYQEKRQHLPVRRESGPHGYGIVVLDDSPHLNTRDERVCVLLGLYKDGEAQELPLQVEDSQIKPINISHQFDATNKVEFTLAFKLQTSTLKADWKHYMILPNDLNLHPKFNAPNDLASFLKGDPVLNWHLCRNLEHIMSVCCIPLGETAKIQDSESTDSVHEDRSSPTLEAEPTPAAAPTIVLENPEGGTGILYWSASPQSRQTAVTRGNSGEASADKQEDLIYWSKSAPKVALTCGDFGDHRVSVSGSYFAFIFMLEMYARFPSASTARARIHAVCRGHLEWIAQLGPEDASCSNVRLDGRRMNRSDETALPPDGPANMPSHILKATEYAKVFSEGIDDILFVCGWLVYRLSDQVWIWMALKSIEDLIQKVQKMEAKVPHETLKEFLRLTSHLPRKGVHKLSTGLSLDFTAEEVRRQNLRRFTLENDVLRTRMLSVTRTARETRFLFHSRDTILYYGLDQGFFSGEEVLWENLIDAQTQHDDARNDQSQWDNPLRYGLALEMARMGHRLESTYTRDEMLTHAREIILASSSENGLFPGQLNDFSKEPVLFDRELFRDFYFHVGFEIPYILLRAMGKPEIEGPKTHSSDRASRLGRQATRQNVPRSLSPIPEPATSALPGYLNIQADGRAIAIQQTLKRVNPYGRLVDLSNIVEVPEEWLYKYPDFLGFTPPRGREQLESLQSEAPQAIQNGMQDNAFQSLVTGNPCKVDMPKCFAAIHDVRKGRKQRKWSVKEKSSMVPHVTYGSLWSQLKQKRCVEDSKKRLIYLKSPDHVVAAMCYVGSPELERVHISQFFDRHAKVDANYLYDDTVAVFNSWVTEVHFRFFQIFTPKRGDMPPQNPQCVRHFKSQLCEVFGSKTYLVDAIMSFRIVGDFFDRYWTCHVVHNFANPEEFEPPIDEPELSQSTSWQQRKVLELVLLNLILKKVCNGAKTILRGVEQGPRSSTSDAGEKYFSKDSFEDRKPGELRECFQLLVILKNNITSLQALVEQWKYRESSQGRERPRWTRSDEQKYRKAIKQRLAHFEDHIREIKATEARIEFLIALVSNAQDAIRSTKSLKQAENITLFTYVTVFFLPAGLAVGVFSMNGIPDHTTIVSMVGTAAVALLVTAGALWCLLGQFIPTAFHTILERLDSKSGPSQTVIALDSGSLREEFADQRLQRLSLGPGDRAKVWRRDYDIESQKIWDGEQRSVRVKYAE